MKLKFDLFSEELLLLQDGSQHVVDAAETTLMTYKGQIALEAHKRADVE